MLEPSAGHPPGYVIYLAAFGLVGLDSPTANRLASGARRGRRRRPHRHRRPLGRAAGRAWGRGWPTGRACIAAFFAAIYPNLWINDALILSESLYAGLMALVILAAYRFWDDSTVAERGAPGRVRGRGRPDPERGPAPAARPGAARWRWCCGTRPGAGASTLAVGSGLVALALMAPWMIRNLATFEEPAPPYLATGSGRVLAFGNCDETYSGRFFGYWNIDCAPAEFSGDESQIDTIHREKATAYMEDHVERAAQGGAGPGRSHVARVPHRRGRRVRPLLRAPGARRGPLRPRPVLPDAARSRWPASSCCWRRRVTIVPLVAPFVLVTFTAASTFGITRYRVPSEVALTILAGLGVAWVEP